MDPAEVHILHWPAVERPARRQIHQRRLGEAWLHLRVLTIPMQARRFDRGTRLMAKSTTLPITCNMAVRMRLLPPLPRTNWTRSSISNNDGAIIEATRMPGGLT